MLIYKRETEKERSMSQVKEISNLVILTSFRKSREVGLCCKYNSDKASETFEQC